MRIVSANLNGIRAAARKGFFDWFARQDIDVLCIQETKAQENQLEDPVFCPSGYHCYYHDAQKKGYSGVAIYSRIQPKKIIKGIGWSDIDNEGRYIEAQFDGLSVISLYMHSGSASEERQTIKFDFMQRFGDYMKSLRRKRREYIICGDWNIVHKEIDIKNWKGNQKNSGCLPEERQWLDYVFSTGQHEKDGLGYIDAFRQVNQEPHQYTWWSNRGNARANNVGWRIDYQIITPNLTSSVQSASVFKDEWYSDHAPLIIDYDYEIKA
ncbi:MAG: exodeoxyribonuclease III [Gammaproteobacteria bacterium]|nr:exodeoxyribonuclease III [Gammaproteobacteria bacterium]